MSEINNLSGEELVLLASVVAIAISQDKSASELNTLALFFSSISSSIATIAATRSSNPSDTQESQNDIILGL